MEELEQGGEVNAVGIYLYLGGRAKIQLWRVRNYFDKNGEVVDRCRELNFYFPG